MPNFSDILIVIFGIISSGLFYFFGSEKLYRFYFGVIMGFLLFLVFNLQIKLFEISGGVSGGWENFLVNNKNFVLGFFSLMIPIFGILFSSMHSDLKSSKLFSSLFGFFLPIFLLGIFAYILVNSAIKLNFLSNIFSFFGDSYIYKILEKTPKIIFTILLIIIFWKYIFRLIIAFIQYLAKLLLEEINDLKGKKNNN